MIDLSYLAVEKWVIKMLFFSSISY